MWRELLIVWVISSSGGTCQDSSSSLHQSLLQYYERMTEVGQHSSEDQKIISLPGLVRSESPCRVAFNFPRRYFSQKLSKVELHVQVESEEGGLASNPVVSSEAVLMVSTAQIKIIAVKLSGDKSVEKVNITGLLTQYNSVKHLEIWVGYVGNEKQIDCSNASVMRPTIFLHYRESTTRFPQLKLTNYLTKRQVGSGELGEARPAEGCQVSRLSLRFSLLGWDRWIISPPGFSPGQCSGLCQSPARYQWHLFSFGGGFFTTFLPLVIPVRLPTTPGY